MRYLMFTGKDGRTEVHRYNDDEVTEVFRTNADALNAQGFYLVHNGRRCAPRIDPLLIAAHAPDSLRGMTGNHAEPRRKTDD
jgi:hypothetical protein